MLTQDSQASAPPSIRPQGAERRVRISRVTPAGVATAATAALGALGLVWLIYEQMLALSGVLGFWLAWYVVFLLLYAWMAWQQWGSRETVDKVAAVAVGTAGVLTCTAVLALVLFVLVKGASAVRRLSFFTQSMAFSGPLSPLSSGGVLHAIVGTLEQIALGTLLAVPLGLLAATFLAELGGPGTRPIRTLVEAMTALPDVIAGLFVYALVILTLGLQKSGLAAALALAVTMMPIVARASEIVIRLVPGALREGSYALGGSHWRTVMNVILPTARPGLATAVVLAMARGIGETSPVLVVSGVTKEINLSPLHGPQMSLPLFIWEYAHVEAVNQAVVARAFGAGFTLVVVVVVLFAAARALGGNAPGELSRREQRRLARQAART